MRVICETERLIVREWTDSEPDLARAFDTYRREEVTKWLGNPAPLSDPALGQQAVRPDAHEAPYGAQAAAGQARREAMYAAHEGRYGVWAVQIRETGIVAGSVLLVPMPEPSDATKSRGEVEIGWHLHPDSWGHGYATEAAKAVLAHGFGLGLDEIVAIAKPTNEPSLAVMRRVGMRHIGRTSRWYGIEAELYQANRGQDAVAL